MKLDAKEALFRQYAYLLQKSFDYTEKHSDLLSAVQTFVDSCKEYDFYRYSRLKPVILHPMLLNNAKDKLLIMVLSRKIEGENKPAEYIHFIYGDRVRGKFIFHLKKGYQRSFPPLAHAKLIPAAGSRALAWTIFVL